METSNRNIIISTNVYNRHICTHLVDDKISDIRVIPDETEYLVGTIVVGRVCKMIPSSGACFVDIGDAVNYFVKIPKSISQIHFIDNKKHKDIHCEDEILVQISTESVKSKAPSASTSISLSGKYIVIEQGSGLSISSKLSESDRKKLNLPNNIKEIAKKVRIIVRTMAIEASANDIKTEIDTLVAKYLEIINKSQTIKAKTVLYKPESPILSCINSWLRYNPSEYITDIKEDYTLISAMPCAKNHLNCRLYEDESLKLCKLYKLETELDELLASRVNLKSGAFLVIEQGETLTAIDVNSAHAISGNKEEASYKINLEASLEIVRQIRARNISGMILIDFINMKDAHNEKALISQLINDIKNDPVRTTYIDITGLGLVELTRQRIFKSLTEQWKK